MPMLRGPNNGTRPHDPSRKHSLLQEVLRAKKARSLSVYLRGRGEPTTLAAPIEREHMMRYRVKVRAKFTNARDLQAGAIMVFSPISSRAQRAAREAIMLGGCTCLCVDSADSLTNYLFAVIRKVSYDGSPVGNENVNLVCVFGFMRNFGHFTPPMVCPSISSGGCAARREWRTWHVVVVVESRARRSHPPIHPFCGSIDLGTMRVHWRRSCTSRSPCGLNVGCHGRAIF
jgi:hypothetical protein